MYSNLLELNCTVHFWQSNGYKVKVIGHDTVAVTLCQYDKLLLEDSSTVAWSLILVWVRNLLRLLIQMSGNHKSSKASSKSNNVLSWALDAWTRESYQLKVKYPCNVKSYDMRKFVDEKLTKISISDFFPHFLKTQEKCSCIKLGQFKIGNEYNACTIFLSKLKMRKKGEWIFLYEGMYWIVLHVFYHPHPLFQQH